MKVDVITLAAEGDGSVDLPESIFGLEPRADILHRVVRYQLAGRQQGSHSTRTRSMTNYSRQKIYRQKGTGGPGTVTEMPRSSARAASTRDRPREVTPTS